MTRSAASRFFLIVFAFFLVSGCAASRGSIIDTGVASWYGPGFHGKTTANGETYDQNAMTAAHRTLPFNTVVRVVNLDNGKSVTVRINDRGPFVDNRVIDLSYAAAREIDMVNSGLARVRLQLVSSEAPVSRRQGPELFTVQLASYNQKAQADEFAAGIRGAFVQSARVDGRTVYRVYYGRYESRDRAERAMRDLNRRGHEGFVKQLQNLSHVTR
ncbi:MAG: septal ring lytic transglycosylase RlpA family protein [Bacteroidetes bacterium]|nr:septal ring lytic transglycosylase RlpA family protein [Bacteroidota bacterium]